jgi:hypothetical protein
MPRHKQVTTCRKSGGPVSKHCSCEHCCLAVCEVCGGAEGTLTSDCPGARISGDRLEEIFETNLDYTDDRGWHCLAQQARSPRFEDAKLLPEPAGVDSRMVVAPSIDWAAVDRTMNLQHALAQKAIAWVLADRACEDSAASEQLAQEATTSLHGKPELDEHDRDRLAALERVKIDFSLACRRVERCDDEFRQAAHRLVAALEEPR